MMKKTLFLAVISASLVAFSACKKNSNDVDINEPVTLVTPDTTATNLAWGGVLPIKVIYATDRAIDFVQTLYEIDTFPDSIGYVFTYPDTLAHLNISANPTNIYTYTGSYTVPDSLPNGSQIRFKTSFSAQGLSYEKEFKILVQH